MTDHSEARSVTRCHALRISLGVGLSLASTLGAVGCGSSDRRATASHTSPVVTFRRGETTRSRGEMAFRRFGDAASDPQLLAIGHALRSYYNALAGSQYAQACGMLAKVTRRQLVSSVRPSRGTTCVGFMSATLARARVYPAWCWPLGRVTTAREVVCMGAPWKHTVAELRLSERLHPNTLERSEPAVLWGVRLTTRPRRSSCRANQQDHRRNHLPAPRPARLYAPHHGRKRRSPGLLHIHALRRYGRAHGHRHPPPHLVTTRNTPTPTQASSTSEHATTTQPQHNS